MQISDSLVIRQWLFQLHSIINPSAATGQPPTLSFFFKACMKKTSKLPLR